MTDEPKNDKVKGAKDNVPLAKLSPSTNEFKGLDVNSLEISFVNHLEFRLAKDEYSATKLDCFKAAVLTVRDRLFERWIETQQAYYKKDSKRIYYISMEFLIGRLLGNALCNLDLYDNMRKALAELGYDLEELRGLEVDAGLGNGGLGRLAACFLDSMATLELPGYGYGIRYEYGIFSQRFTDGYQIEAPDNWLRLGNPWEIERPEYTYPVKFYGRVVSDKDADGRTRFRWIDTDDVLAMAYDTPIPGYRNNTVNNLRLWGAKSTSDFYLEYFNHGDYEKAVADKIDSETLTKLLYPRDDVYRGKELRLKQEYFLVSATLQDIVRRYKKIFGDDFEKFPDKVAIQLNDTHPALAIPELMRIFIDEENMDWDRAWSLLVDCFGYTNHTVLPEALEKWPVELLGRLLPRHLQIIYEINYRFLQSVGRSADRNDRLRRMSIIIEGENKYVNMAHLAIVGSHSVNGVAAIHTDILKTRVFSDFYEKWPEKFNNKTNGITQRRWLKLCNPLLANLITSKIGAGWVTDLYKLEKLAKFAEVAAFQKKWRQVKRANKERLGRYIEKEYGIDINIDSIFDCQIKRIHEYKRQLLNALHVVTLYNEIKADPAKQIVPRTVIFGGKAAPGYYMAKLIVKLINSIAEVVNNDEDIGDKLKVVFLRDYSVSLAELIIPAADLSEQISTAGYEASGTGNMKFALNGALTIGTLDGANIEILDEVGAENMFIFGLDSEQVVSKQRKGHHAWGYVENDPALWRTIDLIGSGHFSSKDSTLFEPIIDSLLENGDYFMVLADYASYVEAQKRVGRIYKQPDIWTKRSILNVAFMGKFSSDRTIQEYCGDIWHSQPVPIKIPIKGKKRGKQQ